MLKWTTKDQTSTDRHALTATPDQDREITFGDRLAWVVLAVLIGLALFIVIVEGGSEFGGFELENRLIDG